MSPSTKPSKKRRSSPNTTPTPLPRGFYSRLLSRIDLADLEASKPTGLTAEIELTRVFIRRLVEYSDQVSSLADMQRLTRSLSTANTSLDRLIKTQEKYFGAGNEINQAVSAALDELRQEGFMHPPGSTYSPDPDENNTA